MARYIRFEESRPSQVREMLQTAPVAYIPFGSLEWHGEHNPLGLDGVKVEELLKRTAEVTGGVLFPTVFWGAFNTMPFPFTFHFSPAIMQMTVWKILRQLRRNGFKVIVMLTGHYPLSYLIHLHLQARILNRKAGAVAMAFPGRWPLPWRPPVSS